MIMMVQSVFQKHKEKNAQLFSERSQSEEKLLQLEKKLKSDHVRKYFDNLYLITFNLFNIFFMSQAS